MRCTTHRTTIERTRIQAPGSKKNGDGNEGQEEDGMGGRKAIAAAAACMEQVKRGIGRQ